MDDDDFNAFAREVVAGVNAVVHSMMPFVHRLAVHIAADGDPELARRLGGWSLDDLHKRVVSIARIN